MKPGLFGVVAAVFMIIAIIALLAGFVAPWAFSVNWGIVNADNVDLVAKKAPIAPIVLIVVCYLIARWGLGKNN